MGEKLRESEGGRVVGKEAKPRATRSSHCAAEFRP